MERYMQVRKIRDYTHKNQKFCHNTLLKEYLFIYLFILNLKVYKYVGKYSFDRQYIYFKQLAHSQVC